MKKANPQWEKLGKVVAKAAALNQEKDFEYCISIHAIIQQMDRFGISRTRALGVTQKETRP